VSGAVLCFNLTLQKGGKHINFFKKTAPLPKPKKAVAFVDYEHWYISLNKNFGTRPNIGLWFDDIKKHASLTEAIFFADFSHQSLADEIRRIRVFSNKIVDTRSTGGSKKDFTDFIILDHIYQKAFASNDIDVFILLTGDGHFSNVVSFLKNIYSKEVGVYGVKNSFSRQLRETASWSVELPFAEEVAERYNKLIFDSIVEFEKKANGKMATIKSVSEIAAAKPNVSVNELQSAFKSLIDNGYLSEREVSRRNKRSEVALFVDWSKLARENIYTKQ